MKFILVLVMILSFNPAFAARSLSLEEAVNLALQDNQKILAARQSAFGSEQGVKLSRAKFGPALSSSYTYTAYEKPLTSSSDKQQMLWEVKLKQELFSGFKTLSQWQQAQLEKDRSAENLQATKLTIVQLVQESFFEYLKAGENIRSANDALTRLQSQLQVTQAFYREGLRPKLDVLQAELDVSRAESLKIQAENNYATQAARLTTLLNLSIKDEVNYQGSLNPIPFKLGLDECLERAYIQRPDLHMADLSILIAGKERKVIQSEYYPTVSGEAIWNTRGSDFNAAGSSGMRTNYSNQGIGLTVEWTVFNFGQTHYADRQASFVEGRLRAEAADLKQEVGFEIKSRLLMARDAEKRIQVATKGVEQGKEAYDVALARYQSQVGTNTDVLDAQAKLTTEEANLTGARADYLSALARLYVAMGEIKPGLK